MIDKMNLSIFSVRIFRLSVLPVIALIMGLVIASTSLGSGAAEHQPKVELPQLQTRLAPHQLRLIEDPLGTLTAVDAAARFESGQGQTTERLNLGLHDGAIWVSLQLRNASRQARDVIVSHEYAPIDELYLFDGDLAQRAGDSLINADSPFLRRLAHFSVRLDANETRALLLRLRSSSNLNLSLSVYSPEYFVASETLLVGAYSVFLGAVLAAAVFLILSFFFYREPTPLALAGYLLSFAAYVAFLNGLFTPWLSPLVGERTNDLHLVAIGMLYGSGALFYRHALRLPDRHPRLDRWMLSLQWLGFALPLVLSVPALRVPAGLVYLFVTGVAPLINSALAVWLWRRGDSFAGVFAVGWLVAHLGALLNTLRIGGTLDLPPIALHLPAIGGAIAIPCFAWGIARLLSRERTMAYTDALTGLANRHRFEIVAAEEMNRARRYDRRLSLVVLDADHFKRVNDDYGHAAGDRALRTVASVMQTVGREADLPARVGGEEFAMLLLETDARQAAKVAQRLREHLATVQVMEPRITISAGVAELSPDDNTPAALLARADEALYAAKDAGRDCVKIAGEE